MRRKTSIFEEVPGSKIPRNLFDLSHEVKMSMKMGMLYPMLVCETLPGETWRDESTIFSRFAPLLSPVMHLIKLKTEFFFVPNRLLSNHWESFITRGQDGTEAPVLPYVTPAGLKTDFGDSTCLKVGSLWDYLGLPCLEGADPATFTTEQLSALPFWAYAKVWNDWYKDPNFDDDIEFDVDAQGDVSTEVSSELLQAANSIRGVLQRGWNKDYFTSALAEPQRGTEVLMPLSGIGDLVVKESDGTAAPASKYLGILPASPGQLAYGDSFNPGVNTQAAQLEIENAETSINDLRTALALQSWAEANARGGPRYIEQIDVHFGQRVPDYRLQRCEFIGGGRQVMQISEVLTTAATSEDNVVGNLYGRGVSVGKSNRFTYRCEEHGWIIGIVSVVPDSAYLQGIERHWSRNDTFDFAFPRLAHLGEQAILSKELFFSFNNADNAANNSTFGYTPRYAEYKYKSDRVAGDFRTTLLFWHESRKFNSRPTLDTNFLGMFDSEQGNNETALTRIFAVQDGTDYIWMQIFHKLTVKRPLPYFGVPKLIG